MVQDVFPSTLENLDSQLGWLSQVALLPYFYNSLHLAWRFFFSQVNNGFFEVHPKIRHHSFHQNPCDISFQSLPLKQHATAGCSTKAVLRMFLAFRSWLDLVGLPCILDATSTMTLGRSELFVRCTLSWRHETVVKVLKWDNRRTVFWCRIGGSLSNFTFIAKVDALLIPGWNSWPSSCVRIGWIVPESSKQS